MLRPHYNLRRELRFFAPIAAIWFSLFVVLVPIFHRHAEEGQSGNPATQRLALTSPSSAMQTPVFHKTQGLVPQNVDDCPICEWFAVGFMPSCVLTILTILATLVQLLFDVRLAELCRRPCPQRGLRAPPVFAC